MSVARQVRGFSPCVPHDCLWESVSVPPGSVTWPVSRLIVPPTVSGPRAMSTAVADTGFVLSTVQCSMPDGVDVAATAVAVVASATVAAAASSAAVRLMFKVPPSLGLPRMCDAGVESSGGHDRVDWQRSHRRSGFGASAGSGHLSAAALNRSGSERHPSWSQAHGLLVDLWSGAGSDRRPSRFSGGADAQVGVVAAAWTAADVCLWSGPVVGVAVTV